MKIIRKIGTAIAAAALALSMAAPAANAGDFRANLEGLASENSDWHYARPNIWYTLPGHIEGYTWGEFYSSGGYYAETYLDRPVTHGFMVASQMEHIDEPFTQAGIGVGYQIPLPENAYANIKFLPFWMDKDGVAHGKMEINYCAGVELKHGIKLDTFGVVNPKIGQWDYGEVTLTKSIGKKVDAGYSAALKNKGTLAPYVEHRAIVRVNF